MKGEERERGEGIEGEGCLQVAERRAGEALERKSTR